MKYILTLVLVTICNVVTAASYNDLIIKLPVDKAEVSVKGSVSVLNNNYGSTHHLCLDKIESYDEAKSCVDLVFNDNEMKASVTSGCFELLGEFKRYSSERVALGWLVSKYGVIEVYKIEKSKC